MSKKHKGLTCVYCGITSSDTSDHIFARGFFLDGDRDNLPQVPACKACNNDKARLEHYATTILPLGGQHRQALTNLSQKVPKRLAKNQRLHREIAENMRPGQYISGSASVESVAVPVDGALINRLMEYVTRGLLYVHFGTLLPSGAIVRATALTEAGNDLFDRTYEAADDEDKVAASLGDDTVSYQGVRQPDSAVISIWRVRIYGGMQFVDASTPGEPRASSFGIGTAPRESADAIGI